MSCISEFLTLGRSNVKGLKRVSNESASIWEELVSVSLVSGLKAHLRRLATFPPSDRLETFAWPLLLSHSWGALLRSRFGEYDGESKGASLGVERHQAVG